MKRFIPIVTLFFCLTMFSTSCKKKEAKQAANCSADFATSITDDLQVVQSLAAAYASNPSAQNCTNLKNAYLDLINAYESVLDCAKSFGYEDSWQKSIDDAKDEAASIC